MQDNAPFNPGKALRRWLEEIGVDRLKSPHSPDLNPIGHLWFGLKKVIYQAKPDIGKSGWQCRCGAECNVGGTGAYMAFD